MPYYLHGDALLNNATATVFQSPAMAAPVEIDHDANAAVSFVSGGGEDMVIDASGTLTLSQSTAPASGSTGPNVFVLGGAALLLDGTQQLTALNVSAGGTARLLASANSTLVTQTLSLAAPANGDGGGVLDLTDNDMIVQSGGLAPITSYLAAGYDGGRWDGASPTTGTPAPAAIVSSVASAEPDVALGADCVGDSGAPAAGSFDGQSVANGNVVVKFTYYGDSNLDGNVNAGDAQPPSSGSGTSGTWENGDFNYDGKV